MPYSPDFELDLIRGEDIDVWPWDLQAEIRSVVHSGDNLLDIGCGTAHKLLEIAPAVRSVVGVEPSADMRHRAEDHIAQAALTNVTIVEGNCDDIPYSDSSFDVVTCMLAPHVTSEVHRVLKPGGVAIMEKLGEQDKTVMKACFPPDDTGKRGQLEDLRPNERRDIYRDEFEALFSEVTIRSGFWSTLLTAAGLDLLLAQTPTIRDFDPIKDQASVQRVKERSARTDGRILTTQHRLLIIATK
ncbi:MAG TPA: class I SAM-dependent methyltransferase [Verrucomicrobiae bacterium]|jgi:SAM-dependent methyltransferase|nr:class I SAM-dependent methyltransferase [Verrucomicrobiae bacterium]